MQWLLLFAAEMQNSSPLPEHYIVAWLLTQGMNISKFSIWTGNIQIYSDPNLFGFKSIQSLERKPGQQQRGYSGNGQPCHQPGGGYGTHSKQSWTGMSSSSPAGTSFSYSSHTTATGHNTENQAQTRARNLVALMPGECPEREQTRRGCLICSFSLRTNEPWIVFCTVAAGGRGAYPSSPLALTYFRAANCIISGDWGEGGCWSPPPTHGVQPK